MPAQHGNYGMCDPDELDVGSQAIAVASTELDKVTVCIPSFTSQTVTVKYRTLPANRPESYGNKVWLWEGTVIDWTHPDLGVSEAVPLDDSYGFFTMGSLEIGRKSYILGYSVTGGVMGICASALINAELLLLAPTSVTIGIDLLEPDKLVISYATLRGYRPLSAGNWLGLWKGDVLPWDAPPPTDVTQPEDDANEGLAIFHSALRPRSTYTVIYFMADKEKQSDNTYAAALLRFDTS
jgi:hypothetical protein